jgi:hypothetical protein
MAADSSPPQQPGRSASDAGDEQAREAIPTERYGPLEVARHVKDDGRALLLYTRIEDEPA